jgi:Leucine-rich repeat (LRR) protein
MRRRLTGRKPSPQRKPEKRELPPTLHIAGVTYPHDVRVLNFDGRGMSMLPDWLGSVSSLTKLILRNNKLSSLPSLGGLENLESLNLENNVLVTLPPSAAELRSLKMLLLSQNMLKELPAVFGERLTRLAKLTVDSNQLAQLPPDFGRLSSLAEAHLEHNQLTALPESFGQLGALVALHLQHNQLSTLPASFGPRLNALSELHLQCNKLTALPAGFGDLAALVHLALDHNRLKGLPESFVRLRRLDSCSIAYNRLEVLPGAFGDLEALRELTLRDNQLLSALPDSFVRLRTLCALNVAGNALESLPEKFGELASLSDLDCSDNQLSVLPDDIGSLRALKRLSLASNRLSELPQTFTALASLERLDVSSNDLASFPHEIDSLREVTAFAYDDNLLPMPPPEARTATQQLAHFARMARKAMVFSRELRCVLIGAAGAGKTSLLRGLQQEETAMEAADESAKDDDAKVEEAQLEQTGVLEISHLTVGDGDGAVRLATWDLGGEQAYAAYQALYFSVGSLYLLCVSAADASSKEADALEEALGLPLDLLQAAAPGAAVLVVVTKCDLLLAQQPLAAGADAVGEAREVSMAEAAAEARERVETLIRARQRAYESRKDTSEATLHVVAAEGEAGGGGDRGRFLIPCVSTVGDDYETLSPCRRALEGLLLATGEGVSGGADGKEQQATAAAPVAALLPSVGQYVPKAVLAAIEMTRALREGREPKASVLKHAAKSTSAAAGMMTKRKKKRSASKVVRPYMSIGEARALWAVTVAPALTPPASPAAFEEALRLLVNQGRVLTSTGLLLLQPDFALSFVQPLLDHRLSHGFALPLVTKYGDEHRSRPMSTPEGEQTQTCKWLLASITRLVTRGELYEEALPLLWDPSGLDGAWPVHEPIESGAVEALLRQLIDTGLLCLAERSRLGRRWLLPSRLPAAPPDTLRAVWTPTASSWDSDTAWSVPTADEVVVELVYRLGPTAPPGIVGRVMAASCALGRTCDAWRGGALIEAYRGRGTRLLITLHSHATPPVANAATDLSDASAAPPAPANAGASSASPAGSAAGYELVLASRGCDHSDAWRFLSEVRARVELILADFPSLGREAVLGCPACICSGRADPTQWALRRGDPATGTGERRFECAACGVASCVPEVFAAAMELPQNINDGWGGAPLVLFRGPKPTGEVADDDPGRGDANDEGSDEGKEEEREEARLSSSGLVIGEPLEAARALHSILGLTKAQLREKMELGAPEIEKELIAISAGNPVAPRDKNGLTPADWVRYVCHEPSVERELPDGVRDRSDKSRTAGMSLVDFTELGPAKAAKLGIAQVLALRLCTCSIFRCVNGPLRRGCTPEAPHPLPALVGHLCTALAALRESTVELPDKGRGHAFRCVADFDLGGSDFLERGGIELGMASATSDRNSAIRDASRGGADAVVLLKIRLDDSSNSPPDLAWCSLFPKETEFHAPIREHAFPPCTHLLPVSGLGARPKPVEEQKKGAAGKEVTVRIIEVIASVPTLRGHAVE